MDNLTHSLVGAVLGQAGLKHKTGLAMPALIIGANLPDVDAACFFWLEGTEHLGFRRGITHGPPAMVLLPLILAGLLWAFDRWQEKRGKRPEGRLPVHFGWLYALSFIGCLSHPALDWLNVYGVRFLEPFSSQWFYGDTLFIIDVWLWALLIASLWWAARREEGGGDQRGLARGAIAVMLAYIGMNWGITQYGKLQIHYREAHTTDAIASPVPFNPFEREYITVAHAMGFQSVWIEDELMGDFWLDTCDLEAARTRDSQLDAFLFWSRAPFAVRADDGSVILYDARFYDPRARGRFSVALPDLKCEELGSD
ncbi:MAG: metal-dependent hydrolase [Erythrobacter sp.]|uniref:metal-dependent hydrolase n=1 Tax=Erythrobacter sp. TaxID=1042 RepID=UPI003A8809F6